MPSHGVASSVFPPGANISSTPLVNGSGGTEIPLAELEEKSMADQVSLLSFQILNF